MYRSGFRTEPVLILANRERTLKVGHSSYNMIHLTITYKTNVTVFSFPK